MNALNSSHVVIILGKPRIFSRNNQLVLLVLLSEGVGDQKNVPNWVISESTNYSVMVSYCEIFFSFNSHPFKFKLTWTSWLTVYLSVSDRFF